MQVPIIELPVRCIKISYNNDVWNISSCVDALPRCKCPRQWRSTLAVCRRAPRGAWRARRGVDVSQRRIGERTC